jgi:hypothetical protein
VNKNGEKEESPFSMRKILARVSLKINPLGINWD